MQFTFSLDDAGAGDGDGVADGAGVGDGASVRAVCPTADVENAITAIANTNTNFIARGRPFTCCLLTLFWGADNRQAAFEAGSCPRLNDRENLIETWIASAVFNYRGSLDDA